MGLRLMVDMRRLLLGVTAVLAVVTLANEVDRVVPESDFQEPTPAFGNAPDAAVYEGIQAKIAKAILSARSQAEQPDEQLTESYTSTPPSCGSYCAKEGCGWTSQWSCPWAGPGGSKGRAKDDGTLGYKCCCEAATVQGECGPPTETNTNTTGPQEGTCLPSSKVNSWTNMNDWYKDRKPPRMARATDCKWMCDNKTDKKCKCYEFDTQNGGSCKVFKVAEVPPQEGNCDASSKSKSWTNMNDWYKNRNPPRKARASDCKWMCRKAFKCYEFSTENGGSCKVFKKTVPKMKKKKSAGDLAGISDLTPKAAKVEAVVKKKEAEADATAAKVATGQATINATDVVANLEHPGTHDPVDADVKEAFPLGVKKTEKVMKDAMPPPFDSSQAYLGADGHYHLGGGRRRVGAGFGRRRRTPTPAPTAPPTTPPPPPAGSGSGVGALQLTQGSLAMKKMMNTILQGTVYKEDQILKDDADSDTN